MQFALRLRQERMRQKVIALDNEVRRFHRVCDEVFGVQPGQKPQEA